MVDDFILRLDLFSLILQDFFVEVFTNYLFNMKRRHLWCSLFVKYFYDRSQNMPEHKFSTLLMSCQESLGRENPSLPHIRSHTKHFLCLTMMLSLFIITMMNFIELMLLPSHHFLQSPSLSFVYNECPHVPFLSVTLRWIEGEWWRILMLSVAKCPFFTIFFFFFSFEPLLTVS